MSEDKSSVEERLEKLEKHKSRDAQRQERAEQLEKLKKTPIKYVEDDPSRIHKSYNQIVAEKRAKREEALEVKKFLAERKKEKEEPKEVEKEVAPAPVKKSGRPKRVE